MLINLCGNAADALLDKGGTISIDLHNETVETKDSRLNPLLPGRYVKIVIRDTGCGMDKATLNRIFEPYFTTKAIGKGTGIGLAVVHGIVTGHNGSIAVASEPGKGTVFTIYLPAHCGRVERDDKDCPAMPLGSERILLVDDEPSILKLGKQRLERLGYTVVGTTNPVKALALFKVDPQAFDLVITDMAMPGLAGDQLATEILRYRPHIPVILCTGYSEKISEDRAALVGIRAFAMKPIDRTEFAITIRKVLDETA